MESFANIGLTFRRYCARTRLAYEVRTSYCELGDIGKVIRCTEMMLGWQVVYEWSIVFYFWHHKHEMFNKMEQFYPLQNCQLMKLKKIKIPLIFLLNRLDSL